MAAATQSSESSLPAEQRYLIEAAKRQRADGTKQFQQLEFSDNDKLRSLSDDIFADHEALDKLPAPINPGGRIKFLIFGAGMGGLVQAIKLIQKGFTADEILLIERAGGVGGTWYWNRYPGLHCDVEAYVYLPLLEETGYIPKQKYSSSVEIRHYLEDLAAKYGLQKRVLFRSQPTSLKWDESTNLWTADLVMRHGPGGKEEKNMSIQAEIAILASGLFPYPHVPKVPGVAEFEGPTLHTGRWHYEITGGSDESPFPEMEKLRGKRIGFIGTGATAIQVVPQLAKYAKELYVFQRTPSQVNTRGQRDTDPAEWKEKIAVTPGWQKHRQENFAEKVAGNLPADGENLVNDGWTQLDTFLAVIGSGRFGIIAPDKAQAHIGSLLALDAQHNTEARQRVQDIVQDKDTASKLTPWYPTWCKRPCFSDMYLETFNNDNVHLVDTDGRGIDKVTAKSIVANGQDYPVDILIFGTGYNSPATAGDPGSKMRLEIVGRNGRSLAEKYDQQGMSTLHGVFSNGYPNLFFQGSGQAGATPNFSHFIDVISEHIACIIAKGLKSSDKQGSVVIEASSAAEDAWGMRIAQTAAFFSGLAICTPSYFNLYGEALRMPPPDDQAAMMKKAKAAVWSKGLVDFTRVIEAWRNDEKLDGVEIRVA